MPQYFDSSPQVRSHEQVVPLQLPDLSLELLTDRGVFSSDHVDVGTKYLLLEGPAPTPGDQHLVDVGCGYGPIACAVARRNPEATVWAVDVNERARDLCARNAESAGLSNVRVLEPEAFAEAFPESAAIDRIWSNPPIRIGKAALHDLLTTWLGRLATGGSAHLVVQKHLGADSLHAWIERQGYGVHRRGSRKAFRLLDVTKEHAS